MADGRLTENRNYEIIRPQIFRFSPNFLDVDVEMTANLNFGKSS